MPDINQYTDEIDVQALLAEAERLVQEAKKDPIDVDNTSLGELVDKLFAIKKDMDKLKDAKSKITNIHDSLEAKIVEKMLKEDLPTISTKSGSFSVTPKSMPSVEDFYSLVKWIAEDIDNRIGFINKKVNEKAVNEMLEEQGLLPPGVKTYIKDKITTRSKK